MQKKEVIREIKKAVREIDASATVILYGSRARGDEGAGSDWDLLILVNKPTVTMADEQVFRHKLCDVEMDTGEAISTFVFPEEDWNGRLSQSPYFKNIKREGVVL